jgi:hypothetical protein
MDPAAWRVAGPAAVGTGCWWWCGQGSMHGEGSSMVNRYVGQPVRKQSGPGPRRKFKFEFQTNSTCSSLIQFKTNLPEVKKNWNKIWLEES